MITIQKAYRFYTMEQRGGLREAVATMKEISEQEFKKLSQNYKYYCYDERIECLRFIFNAEGDSKIFYILISQCSLPTIKEITRRFLNK